MHIFKVVIHVLHSCSSSGGPYQEDQSTKTQAIHWTHQMDLTFIFNVEFLLRSFITSYSDSPAKQFGQIFGTIYNARSTLRQQQQELCMHVPSLVCVDTIKIPTILNYLNTSKIAVGLSCIHMSIFLCKISVPVVSIPYLGITELLEEIEQSSNFEMVIWKSGEVQLSFREGKFPMNLSAAQLDWKGFD